MKTPESPVPKRGPMEFAPNRFPSMIEIEARFPELCSEEHLYIFEGYRDAYIRNKRGIENESDNRLSSLPESEPNDIS